MGRARVVPLGPVRDYWERWETGDALLLPRRYGGLSLVAQEALAAGMAVVMLDREPERRWPIVRARTGAGRLEHMKGGAIGVLEGDPVSLAERIRQLATTELAHWSALADRWAATMSWETLLPAWRAALGMDAS